MKTYNEVEEHISAARRFYNSAITQLKNSIMIFPESLFKGCASDAINCAYYEANSIDLLESLASPKIGLKSLFSRVFVI